MTEAKKFLFFTVELIAVGQNTIGAIAAAFFNAIGAIAVRRSQRRGACVP